MFAIEYKDIAWWYWLATVCCITSGIAGFDLGYNAAIGITAIHLVHFILREKAMTAFSVQVRYWYLILLIISYPEPVNFIYWLPAIGTWVQLIFGYCAMARCVSLLPWNRNKPLTIHLLFRTFFSPPVRGSIIDDLSAEK